MRNWAILLAAFGLAACANNFEQFYRPLPGGHVPFSPVTGEPHIVPAGANVNDSAQAEFRRGFAPIGMSGFVGPVGSQSDLLAQAKKVGAQEVMISSTYQNTAAGNIPLTLPHNTTSTTTGNVYGYGGTATYTGTTTTYGTETVNIPYSVDRYQQIALYFAPLARQGLGVLAVDLSDADKQVFEVNHGLRLVAIRDGSPADTAGLILGDVILAADGEPIDSRDAFFATYSGAGNPVALQIVRNGKKITKTVGRPTSW